MGYNTLATYIRDVRSRIDDDPIGGVQPYFSDAQLTIFINNARRKISIDLRAYLSQMYVIPTENIDEYSLPKDYLQSSIIVDVKNQRNIPPINQANAETTKMMYDTMISYGNFAFINNTRKKLTFNIPINSNFVEPTYNVQAFSRTASAGIINVNAVSSGTFANISQWDKVKGYCLVTQASSGETEYIRYSRIIPDTTANTYSIYVSAFDLTKKYKDNIAVYGTIAISSTNTTIYGTNTKFTTDLTAADLVTVGADVRQISSIASDTVAVVNSAFTLTVTGNTMYVDNKNTYAGNNDTVQFVSYVMNYYGMAKDLQYFSEECGFDYQIQQLVPTLASSEAFLRQSRKQEAMSELQEYNAESQKIFTKLNQAMADAHNRSQVY
ncbi:MAG: hypothetical protein HGB12_00220 [Bacteroidetes bacterium]|nr:hypothetical protein [Bacteroidota bacterium]